MSGSNFRGFLLESLKTKVGTGGKRPFGGMPKQLKSGHSEIPLGAQQASFIFT